MERDTSTVIMKQVIIWLILTSSVVFSAKTVKVTLHSCASISQEDVFTASDVYAVLCINGNCATSTRIDDSVNPVWGEFWTFTTTDPSTQPLSINLYDYDSFTASEYLGGLTSPISQLKKGIPETYTSVSFTTSPFGTGDCTFTIEALDFNTITSEATGTESRMPTPSAIITGTLLPTTTASGPTPSELSLSPSHPTLKGGTVTVGFPTASVSWITPTPGSHSVSSTFPSTSGTATPAKTETQSSSASRDSSSRTITYPLTTTITQSMSRTRDETETGSASPTSTNEIGLPTMSSEVTKPRSEASSEISADGGSSHLGGANLSPSSHGESDRVGVLSKESSFIEVSRRASDDDSGSEGNNTTQARLKLTMQQLFEDGTRSGVNMSWETRRQASQNLYLEVGVDSLDAPSYNVSLSCSPYSFSISPLALLVGNETPSCTQSSDNILDARCDWETLDHMADIKKVVFSYRLPSYYNSSLQVRCVVTSLTQVLPLVMNYSLGVEVLLPGQSANTPAPAVRRVDSFLRSSVFEGLDCLEPFFLGALAWLCAMIYASIFSCVHARCRVTEKNDMQDTEMSAMDQLPEDPGPFPGIDTHRNVPLCRSLLLNHFWLQVFIPCHEQCAHSHVSIWVAMYGLLLLFTTALARLTFSASASNPWLYAVLTGCIASFLTTALRPVYSTPFWLWEPEYSEGPTTSKQAFHGLGRGESRSIVTSGTGGTKSIRRYDAYGVTELNAAAAHESEAETEASFRSGRASTATSARSSHSMGLKNSYRVNPIYTEGENGEQQPVAAFDFTLEEVDPRAAKGDLPINNEDDDDLNLDLEDDVVIEEGGANEEGKEEKALTLDNIKLDPDQDLGLDDTIDLEQKHTLPISKKPETSSSITVRQSPSFGRKSPLPRSSDAPLLTEVRVKAPNPTSSASLTTPLGGASAFKKAKENSIRRALSKKREEIPDEIEVEDDDTDEELEEHLEEELSSSAASPEQPASQASASPLCSLAGGSTRNSPLGSRRGSVVGLSRQVSPAPSSFLGSRPPTPSIFDHYQRDGTLTEKAVVARDPEPISIVRPSRRKGHILSLFLAGIGGFGAFALHYFGKQTLEDTRGQQQVFWCDHFLVCYIMAVGIDFLVIQPLCVALSAIYRWMALDDVSHSTANEEGIGKEEEEGAQSIQQKYHPDRIYRRVTFRQWIKSELHPFHGERRRLGHVY